MSGPGKEGPAGDGSAELRVLVVDDAQPNRMMAEAMLRRGGYVVDVAEDGVQALEMIDSRPYVAVLMDLRMPRMDGLEATREIRQRPGLAGRTPVIAMTASTDEAGRQACLAAGMNDFMPKPLRKDELLDCLSVWCRLGASSQTPGDP